ncbi:MAG: hypothetical protein CM1200mP9_02380 [Gammaproteobacteria bacterium]|nr:MAG: hypothetical protein CM1200mP9_02380 [Gammaproteobacteria bacterium]
MEVVIEQRIVLKCHGRAYLVRWRGLGDRCLTRAIKLLEHNHIPRDLTRL